MQCKHSEVHTFAAVPCGILHRMPSTVQRRSGAILLIALLLGACAATTPRPDAPGLPDPVMLISIDGLHPDQVTAQTMPVLHALAESGVRARWMNPSYPTLTFPNHYTLVTGLRPDHHGIVDNTMWDENLGRFVVSDRKAVETSGWWGGEPIWNLAGKAGLRTAAMFWVGSEAPIDGRQPDEWHRFSKDFGIAQRLQTVLGWFDQPAAQWPRFATLYFEHVDVAGHSFGPGSAEQLAAASEVDTALGELLTGLKKRGLGERINLIVVSDHGMAAASNERVMYLEDLVDGGAIRVIAAGEVVAIQPVAGHESAAEAALLGRHGALQCWRREQLPPAWHYGTHPRIPAIVCQADEGWKVFSRASFSRWGGQVKPGSHGYAPELPSMRAAFIAHGPAFRNEVQIEPFDNVDVYSLMTRLLGLSPAANDGSIEALLPALIEP